MNDSFQTVAYLPHNESTGESNKDVAVCTLAVCSEGKYYTSAILHLAS